jgi:hypothetical protein
VAVGLLFGLVGGAVPGAGQVEKANDPHEGPHAREDQVGHDASATYLDAAEGVEAGIDYQKGQTGQECNHAYADSHAACTRVVVHGTRARLVHLLRGYAAKHDYCEYLDEKSDHQYLN